MDSSIDAIRLLVHSGNVRISEHGYDELADDGILVRDVVTGVVDSVVIQNYPDYPKGPCGLVLERDGNDEPIHAVWGIPRGQTEPDVLVTAYRPDPTVWKPSFVRRRA